MPRPIQTVEIDGKRWDRWRCETCGADFLRRHRGDTMQVIEHVYCGRRCSVVGNKRLTRQPGGDSQLMRFRYHKEPQL